MTYMAIPIPMDEAEAFDRLAILFVKTAQTGKKQPGMGELSRTIIKRIGKPLYRKIMDSIEVERLVKANSEVFQLLDKIRGAPGNSMAHLIDNANMERYAAKRDIQRKFFSGELKERKYGHPKA